METLLTVIVPSYNAQAYLGKNLTSLCEGGQRMADRARVEILVINDGSSDRTGAIGEYYAGTYPGLVRVIHKENGGHGSGINCGVREAAGRWLKVVDADDWVDPEGFFHLLEALEKSEDDAVVSGFYWRYDNGSGDEETFEKKVEIREPFPGVQYGVSYKFDEIADRLYLKMHGITWRTEMIRNVPCAIDEHCYYVDAEYILYPIPWVKRISFVADFVYQYRIGRGGQSVSPEKMIQNKKNYDKVLESLFHYYERCSKGEIPCSQAALAYMERGIARIAAGKIKILLSLPSGREARNELVQFEHQLKSQYPSIYRANGNRAVSLLRLSRYSLYRPAAWMLQRKKREF